MQNTNNNRIFLDIIPPIRKYKRLVYSSGGIRGNEKPLNQRLGREYNFSKNLVSVFYMWLALFMVFLMIVMPVYPTFAQEKETKETVDSSQSENGLDILENDKTEDAKKSGNLEENITDDETEQTNENQNTAEGNDNDIKDDQTQEMGDEDGSLSQDEHIVEEIYGNKQNDEDGALVEKITEDADDSELEEIETIVGAATTEKGDDITENVSETRKVGEISLIKEKNNVHSTTTMSTDDMLLTANNDSANKENINTLNDSDTYLSKENSLQSDATSTNKVEGDINNDINEKVASSTDRLDDVFLNKKTVISNDVGEDESKVEKEENNDGTKQKVINEKADDIENTDSEEELNVEQQANTREEVDINTQTFEQVDINELRRQFRDEIEDEIRKDIELEVSKNCMVLPDGSYYCFKIAEYVVKKSSEKHSQVYTNRDEDGDDEIYLQKGGEIVQITNNTNDDRFPAYDASTKNIVWQSLVESRWQIMHRDTVASSTIQLTDGDTNNMNPFIHDGTVVWQSWIDGNWEVVVAKRNPDALPPLSISEAASSTATSTAQTLMGIADGWELQRITTNTWHDMFPRVAAGLVTWQAHANGVWQVYMHDLATGETSLLSEGDGAYENPRFAVVWEKRNEDGSVEVIGYDFSTGETDNFAKQKPKIPEKLPELPINTEVPMPHTSTSTSATTTLIKNKEEA